MLLEFLRTQRRLVCRNAAKTQSKRGNTMTCFQSVVLCFVLTVGSIWATESHSELSQFFWDKVRSDEYLASESDKDFALLNDVALLLHRRSGRYFSSVVAEYRTNIGTKRFHRGGRLLRVITTINDDRIDPKELIDGLSESFDAVPADIQSAIVGCIGARFCNESVSWLTQLALNCSVLGRGVRNIDFKVRLSAFEQMKNVAERVMLRAKLDKRISSQIAEYIQSMYDEGGRRDFEQSALALMELLDTEGFGLFTDSFIDASLAEKFGLRVKYRVLYNLYKRGKTCLVGDRVTIVFDVIDTLLSQLNDPECILDVDHATKMAECVREMTGHGVFSTGGNKQKVRKLALSMIERSRVCDMGDLLAYHGFLLSSCFDDIERKDVDMVVTANLRVAPEKASYVLGGILRAAYVNHWRWTAPELEQIASHAGSNRDAAVARWAMAIVVANGCDVSGILP